jgi:2-iminobutanoate/2-iminopropanoate deaminase
MEIIYTKNAPDPVGPYSQAVKHGNTIYVSGQIGLDPATGKLVTDTIQNETHQVMKNLGEILKQGGSSLDRVLKCSIFIRNMGDFATINEIYGSYLSKENPPARETVEVTALPKGVSICISCVAAVD